MKIRLFYLVVMVILVTGCTSNNFKRLDLSEVTLGVSDRQTVLKAVGNPGREWTRTNYASFGVPVKEITHKFIKPDKSSGDLAYYYREQSLLFGQDILVGYIFVSGLPGESTFFDVMKTRLIRPGETDMDEVIELLGPHAGERIPPATCGNSARELIYNYYYDLKVPFNENFQFEYGLITRKTVVFVVRFDMDGVVTGLSTDLYC